MTELALDCGAATDTGLVRECNEDRYWVEASQGIFLVVDGVGGQAAGECAAEIAVSAVREAMADGLPAPPAVRVRQAIAAANNCIYAAAQKNPELEGMACVLTLAQVDGEQVTVGHVGDSRLYLIDLREIRKVTSDHSPVGEVEDAGELSEEEAMTHPRRHEVFREVGSCPRSANDDEFIEVLQCEFPKHAAMILCSDGLSDHLTSRKIHDIAERYAGDAAQTARNLVAAANQAGGRDNITAVFVAGPDFGGRTGATRPRLGITRFRPRRDLWRERISFLAYGLLIGMLLWAALRRWS
jgi:serine/threonine protein phosphatase PrpC